MVVRKQMRKEQNSNKKIVKQIRKKKIALKNGKKRPFKEIRKMYRNGMKMKRKREIYDM